MTAQYDDFFTILGMVTFLGMVSVPGLVTIIGMMANDHDHPMDGGIPWDRLENFDHFGRVTFLGMVISIGMVTIQAMVAVLGIFTILRDGYLILGP